ncbi:MAG: H-NS histone family protein [Aromatoleum sp.]|jgi:hypothetical protein|uniref:H-NS histone family protein n=1 Tax=Aromatoleum sp. TaxID=2307007 RepID=UPI002894B1A3|nr:H-NS histone family protein [Aromatoleum sp.]MDT3672165.1 H-NS histone family protein [Aromatoleum sp.]
MLKMEGAPFPVWLDSLVPTAGSCNDCPKRTANSRDLFSDIDADVCTDPACFGAKKAAQVERQKAAAEARGQKVITGNDAAKIAPYGASSQMKGFIALDSKNYDAGFRVDVGHSTNREILGDRDVPITLIEDVRTGTLIEAVDSKAIAEALKEVGIKSSTPGRSAADLKREAEAKFEAAFRRRLFDETRTAIRVELNGSKNPSLKLDDMRLVARQFWARSGHYACAPLAKLYVSTEEKLDDHARIHRVSALIDTFNSAQLIQFLFDLSLIGTLDVPSYSSKFETPAPLVDTATSFGIRPDVIREGLKAAAKAKAAKKPTAKADPAIRYRHPDNPDQAWTGRGKKPQWVQDWLNAGRTLQELEAPMRCDKTVDMLEEAA